MSRTLWGYIFRRYLVLLLQLWTAVLAIFLVTDFVDRAKSYSGPNWVPDAAQLYAYKALVVMHQVAPGVFLVAAAVLVSSLRRNRELTAMKALAFSPVMVLGPVVLVATLFSTALIGFNDWVVARANWMVEEITAVRFHRWGDWQFHATRSQWFRRGDRVFNLQGGDAEEGFGRVTILGLSPDFTLTERIEAKRMEFVSGTRWRLLDVTERHLADGTVTSSVHYPAREYDLDVGQQALNVRPGKPDEMRLHTLRQQIRAREQVGLPDALFKLEMFNRFAYPLTGIPAALLAALVALRRARSASLTGAFVEGLLISTGLWGVMVVARSLVLGGRMSPAIAAWLPVVLLAVAVFVVMRARPGAGRRWADI